MMTMLRVLLHLCAAPHFFTIDNCLLYVDTPHKPVIYLAFTALVIIKQSIVNEYG